MSTVPTSDIEKEWLNVSVNHHLGAELARNNNNALEIVSNIMTEL